MEEEWIWVASLTLKRMVHGCLQTNLCPVGKYGSTFYTICETLQNCTIPLLRSNRNIDLQKKNIWVSNSFAAWRQPKQVLESYTERSITRKFLFVVHVLVIHLAYEVFRFIFLYSGLWGRVWKPALFLIVSIVYNFAIASQGSVEV